MREVRSDGGGVVDSERELTDLLVCGDDKDSEQAEGTELQRNTGRRSEAITSWKGQGTLWREGASATVFGHDEGCPSKSAITGVVSGGT